MKHKESDIIPGFEKFSSLFKCSKCGTDLYACVFERACFCPRCEPKRKAESDRCWEETRGWSPVAKPTKLFPTLIPELVKWLMSDREYGLLDYGSASVGETYRLSRLDGSPAGFVAHTLTSALEAFNAREVVDE